ncbi:MULTISPECIES: hypothetical protein [unclassified Endozoicomonas]|uniref:hypothetical protein n=1 Tax=unclassified Endozoicomonas TaxID=2644528 RepID=UPI0021493326|nr:MULTISPECIES: hypothetical protein [unclassified Endozoicomonas]
MLKLQRYLARLIAPVFLLQALSTEAQTFQPSTTSPTASTPYPTVSCESLSEQTMGVRQRLDEYSRLVRGRQCIVLNADPTVDTARLISQIPENTVILLSSSTPQGVPPSPSVNPVTGKTPVSYFIDSEIILKAGQDIIGAADKGFEIVTTLSTGFKEQFMIRHGNRSDFHFGETRDNHIKHITFQPSEPDGHRPIKSIILAYCYNHRLIVANNLFYLPDWYGVELDCRKSLDASADDERTGPGLQFADNMIIGETFSAGPHNITSLYGINIILPAIYNQSQKIAIVDNRFQGRMADVGKISLGAGTSIDIFRNTIDIDNSGGTHLDLRGQQTQKGGFILTGITDTGAKPPRFNLAGNQIRVTDTAISIEALIALALACNFLQAVNPWQHAQLKNVTALNPLPLAGECEKCVSPTVISASISPPTYCHIVNTWSAINNSTAAPLSGMTNFVGTFFFDFTHHCPTVISICPTVTIIVTKSSSDRISTVSSVDATTISTALGVMASLAVLLNL